MIQLSVERELCCAVGELLQEKHIIVIAPLPLYLLLGSLLSPSPKQQHPYTLVGEKASF